MPFDVKMPDGTLIRNVPDGTTQEDILERYQLSQQPVQPAPAATAPTAAPRSRSTMDEIGRQIGLTARAGYEAFTSPATAVLEAGRGVYNLGAQALGSESRMPSFYGEQEKMLSSVLPTPENATERAVQAGTQAMAGTAGMAKVAPNVTALSADLVRQIPASAAAGVVSQPTAEVVKEITGSDTAATIAGILTGTVAAASVGKGIDYKYRPRETIAQVKDRASKSYQAVDNAGITVKSDSVKRMFNQISTALDENRMVPGSTQANEINASLTQLSRMLGSNDSVPFSTIDAMRATLNDLKTSPDANIKRLANVAVTQVDDYISNINGKDIVAGKDGIDKAVKDIMSARKDWRNAGRAQTLEDALDVAEVRAIDPKASESELIRRGFINLAANKDKMKLFTPSEQNIIKGVAKGGPFDTVLSMIAKFSPLRSQLMAAGQVGLATQAPTQGIALGLAGGGLSADLLQSYLRRQAATRGIQEIAAGATPRASNLGYRGLLTGALNPPQGNVSVQGISDEDLQRLFVPQ
jgi:hypothetical protein